MRHPLFAISDAELFARLPEAKGEQRESIRISNAGKDEVDFEIYDILWPWESKRLINALKETETKVINLRINSPGGDAFGGVAIYNALVRHKARVITHVDGVAASAASIAAMAGDEIRMGTGTFIMIHEAGVFAAGTASDFREIADVLEKIDAGLAEVYVARTGKSEREVRALMKKETWFNADEAIKQGFADKKSNASAVKAAFDFSVYAHAPDELVAAGREAAQAEERSINTIRDFEAFLRDEGGFSHSAAKAIAARGYKAEPEPRDEDGGSLLETIQAQLAQTRLAVALHS